ncbi:Uncharacterised protein [Legionella steigerwaltii]|uniref:Cupin domain n=1 Tax=Legionella steigerwaltii TaxID=460 RepID=A0A378L4G9_9GAMM|nr:hypothetical protein [Legionella steigerwaltii]KTD77259.1 hypothetical protein Lstg_1616 [Legionella steigerwaltii]STY21985.1 Uncharacterised protein [Legionella steigerwaltii]
MRNYITSILCVIPFLASINSYADVKKSVRTPQLSNEKVSVWTTVIYPNKEQSLKMHRHEHDRVVVALDSGELKVVNNKGKEHFLKLEKDKAYYLKKDVPGELHTDENMGKHPIRVVVIELKK